MTRCYAGDTVRFARELCGSPRILFTAGCFRAPVLLAPSRHGLSILKAVRPPNMTSPPNQHETIESPIDPGSASQDAPVTPGLIRDSFRTLARQIAALVRATFRQAANRAAAWWSDGRTVVSASGASFGSRWTGLKAKLASSTGNTRWQDFDPGSRLQHWRHQSWPALTKMRGRLPRVNLPGKYLAASLGAVLAFFTAYILYCVATLPITGGLQVEATQSALTFEGAQGEVFAARGVFKGDRLTAEDMPPHLAQAIVAIEDRRFFDHIGIDLRGILRAGWRNSQAGGTREGGSTITQQ
ncbi:MAG: biosynthetic peptidoglycan transglycosylase, partial [Bradyrhizobium sp.]|nr:biosynthetic peptidoglycan transglycosylase [Bradyrhizobium sp.]